MEKLKTKDIVPHNENVVVSIEVTEKSINGLAITKELASKANVEFYIGKVEALGETANSNEQCPEVKTGDIVIFNQFAGAVATTSDNYTKVITGHDIVAISKTTEMKLEDITPTSDRILVEILNENLSTNGLSYEESLDARDKQTQCGRIIKLGSLAKTPLQEGTIVYFDPYQGNLILNETTQKLKVLSYRDILYSV